MSGGLYGKAALVTNGCDALGLAICRRLGMAGAKVFLTDPVQDRLQKTVHELNEVGIIATGAVVDLFQADHRQKLFEEVSYFLFCFVFR